MSFKISNVYLNKTSIENYKTYNTLYHQGVIKYQTQSNSHNASHEFAPGYSD